MSAERALVYGRAEVADMVALGLAIAEPVRRLGRDATVQVTRTGLEWVLEQPAVKGPVEQATQYAALRIATSLAERTVADILTAAESNAVTSTALGLTTTAFGVAGQAANHPLSRAARRFAMRNPLARATTSTWVGLAERAVSTSLAQAATNVALDSVVDVVADVVMDVMLEVGPEIVLEVAEQAARQAAADFAAASATGLARLGLAATEFHPVTASAVEWTVLAARSEPARLAADVVAGTAEAISRSGAGEAVGRQALRAADRAARTELGRALADVAEETARATLRDRMKDTVRESVRLAWTRSVAALLGGEPPPPLPQDPMTRAARRITEMIVENPYADAAKGAATGIAVKVSFRMAPSAVPKIAVSAARSATRTTQNRALKLLP